MAVSIRLSRGGSKKRPYYRIVVADARSPRDGNFIERIGSYNPLLAKDDANRVVLNTERAKHWLGVGAQPTDRVARFLDAAGVRERAARSNPNKGKPGEKALERIEEQEKKAAEAAEAAAAAAAVPEFPKSSKSPKWSKERRSPRRWPPSRRLRSPRKRLPQSKMRPSPKRRLAEEPVAETTTPAEQAESAQAPAEGAVEDAAPCRRLKSPSSRAPMHLPRVRSKSRPRRER